MVVTGKEIGVDGWYTRPIFSVSDIDKSLIYYCEMLGFTQAWNYEEKGKTIVSQVNKGSFELILTSNLNRTGLGRVFVSLNGAELIKLEDDIKENQIDFQRIHWGYPAIRISDPDGNEMIFPIESET